MERNERNNASLFGTCSMQRDRNERNTPLGGVTFVTLGHRVPMPPKGFRGGTDTPTYLSTHTGGMRHGC
jgi:hypothetical protein